MYVPPTRPPTTTPKVTSTEGKPCDDEDCVSGSGSGEVTTEDNNTGSSEKGKLNYVKQATLRSMVLMEFTLWYGLQFTHSFAVVLLTALTNLL